MHHRRSIRLEGYDYTQDGAYFVTLCTHERRHLFGAIVDGAMVLNPRGEVVREEWERTAKVRANIELDAFVIMPNHVHGIIVIAGGATTTPGGDPIPSSDAVGAQCIAPLPSRGVTTNNVAPNSLGAIVRGFKAAVTRRINTWPDAPDHPIWQRNYFEHIIRSENTLQAIRAYIAANPSQWAADSLHTASLEEA